jgi:hypothetical protein
MDVFNTDISIYLRPTDHDHQHAVPFYLVDWLKQTSNPVTELFLRSKTLVDAIRKEPDESVQKGMKKRLPGIVTGCRITPGCARLPEYIESLTGWMQIDIDPGHNPSITDWCEVRDQLINLDYVCFTALSVRGRGVWGLVKVKHPDMLKDHHAQLCYDMHHKYGIVLDPSKGGNPTDLRFYSYDPDARMKPRFRVYDRLPQVVVRRIERQNIDQDDVFAFAHNFAKKHAKVPGEFTRESNRHYYLYAFCCALNRCGVSQSEAESYIDHNIMPLSEVKSNAIEYAYRKNQSEFGIWSKSTR